MSKTGRGILDGFEVTGNDAFDREFPTGMFNGGVFARGGKCREGKVTKSSDFGFFALIRDSAELDSTFGNLDCEWTGLG